MTKPHPTASEEWLALHSASKQLGVSPSTLRQWADQGKVRAFRTPGGHRRFSEIDLRALRSQPHLAGTSPARDIERLIHGALGRVRLEIGSGRLERAAWYRGFDDAAKQRHRELGHRLMTLLLEAAREEPDGTGMSRSARNLGKEYGRASLRQGTTLPDALRAFLFFRDYIMEDLINLASRSEADEGSYALDIYRRLSAVVNEMLVAMVETYYGGKVGA
ncbi:MAG TPA: helix-turn-helix domain-containing protein [Anaerolineae bacterium]|jgi:DNA binding domain, excisionase family